MIKRAINTRLALSNRRTFGGGHTVIEGPLTVCIRVLYKTNFLVIDC